MNNIISKLNNDELKMFSVKKYEKDAIVFHEGELCESIGIVDTGEIEIVSYNYSGKEIVFTRIGPGMMFGNNLVFSSDPYFKGNVIATKKATIYLIKKDKIVEIFQQNRDFLLEFLNYQSNASKELNGRIRLLNLPGAEERFFYYLQSQNGVINYSTITQLASILNLQRETLSRLIYKLIKDNKISKTGHTIRMLK